MITLIFIDLKDRDTLCDWPFWSFLPPFGGFSKSASYITPHQTKSVKEQVDLVNWNLVKVAFMWRILNNHLEISPLCSWLTLSNIHATNLKQMTLKLSGENSIISKFSCRIELKLLWQNKKWLVLRNFLLLSQCFQMSSAAEAS